MPNHVDLLENNIHVNPSTGRITGICDWAGAEVSPFGMSVGGVETLLGIQHWTRGWCYHANHQVLRDLFWETFWNAIGPAVEEQKERVEVARLVGILLDNGFQLDDDGNMVPVVEGHHSCRYLDGVVLGK